MKVKIVISDITIISIQYVNEIIKVIKFMKYVKGTKDALLPLLDSISHFKSCYFLSLSFIHKVHFTRVAKR